MKQRSNSFYENLFYWGYAICIAYSFLVHISMFSTLMKYLMVFSIVLFFCVFLLSGPYTIKEINTIIIALILSALIALSSSDLGLFKLIIFIASMKKINFKKLVRFDIIMRITGVL